MKYSTNKMVEYMKLKLILLAFFGLFLLYESIVTPYLIFKYIFLVFGIVDINILIVSVGLYNYHHGNYDWVDD